MIDFTQVVVTTMVSDALERKLQKKITKEKTKMKQFCKSPIHPTAIKATLGSGIVEM